MTGRDPLALLVELLQDDKAAGMPWTPEDFAQRVSLACRQTSAGRSWSRALIDCYPVFADAYADRRAGALERFDLRSFTA